MLDQSTICAISTPPGTGGIAVIRLSGGDAFLIADRVYRSPSEKKRLIDQPANSLHFGTIVSEETVVDEVVVGLFKAPHSFTGEEIGRAHV